MGDLVKFYFFKKHKIWFLLTLSASILELMSLYFQHVMLLKPCVLCIYQRCALFGIMISGILLAIAPFIFKIMGSLLWIYSSWEGFFLAKKQNDIHLYPSPFNTCDFFVNFPSWLPLNQWMPFMFYANGDCTENKWYFLTLEMSQWMMIIFLIYFIIPNVLIICYINKYFKYYLYNKIYKNKKQKHNNT